VLGFDDAAGLRTRALDELAACRARVPGTSEEAALGAVLEGLDLFPAPPKAELKAEGKRRELLLNGDRVKVSVEIDPSAQAPGWFEALSAIGAFHPEAAAKLKDIGGLPLKGTLRYALFLDRVVERFETSSVKRRALADSDFALPPGLKRVPMEGLEGPPERNPSPPPKGNP
jgi:hypothetical protein